MTMKSVLLFMAPVLALTLSGCSGAMYQPLEIQSVGLIPNAKIEKNLHGTANGKSLALAMKMASGPGAASEECR